MRLGCEEFEGEIGCLRDVVVELRGFRKLLLMERYD